MNEMQIFKNREFGTIRTISNEQGEALFCAKDVCDALGYKQTHKAVERHVDKEDGMKRPTPTASGIQTMLYINESGLYALIEVGKRKKIQALGHQRSPAKHPQTRRLHRGKTARKR